MTDPLIFGRTFAAPSFANWRVMAKVIEGVPLTAVEHAVYRALAGREDLPAEPVPECYFVKTRRSGGTLFFAAVGLHAALEDYRAKLGPGEVATIPLIACDRRQSRQLMNYVKGLAHGSPIIEAEIERETEESVHFRHRVVVEVHVGSFRSVRGYSIPLAVLDEMAFYRSELSANPDRELIRSLRPALANLNGRLFGFSSPHARRGHLWDMYKAHYGRSGRILVMQCLDPVLLNPTLNRGVIDAAHEEDAESARSEWGGQFRSDISTFLEDALIDAAVEAGCVERAPLVNYKGGPVHYHAFVDPSGGRHDAMTLGIAHVEDKSALLDHLSIARPPFDPETVVGQFAQTLKRYRLTSCTGDAYSAEWVRSAFAKAGVTYIVSERDKSALYVESLPLFTQHRVRLLDQPRLLTELRLLERRPRPGGRGDLIDHPPRGTDDAANSAIGSLWLASRAVSATKDRAIGIMSQTAESFLSGGLGWSSYDGPTRLPN